MSTLTQTYLIAARYPSVAEGALQRNSDAPGPRSAAYLLPCDLFSILLFSPVIFGGKVVCVCVCVCLGPFQTGTMVVCTQVPNRSWGWGAVLSRQRLCHVSAAGKTAQLTLSTVWALPKDSEFMQVETSLGTDGGSSSSTLSTQIHI